RPAGIDKGSAVKTLLAEHDPEVRAAYLGDDTTDEDAFRAISDRGLAVLVRNKARTTDAHIRLAPPRELLEFLDCWLSEE
ncbi:MAG: trehalose-phosphatase, partial [candidate division Zixibacteria bacterium]